MRGSGEAQFEAFAARRQDALVRSAFLLLGDRHQAEDLVQTALYRTFTAWGRLRSTDAADAYARRTMVRLAMRWRARRWTAELVTDPLPDVATPGVADHVVIGLDVMHALAQLPVQQRAVLVLRYFEDLSEAATADVLRCSVGTVKSRANRALAALRHSLDLVVDETSEVTRD